MTAGSKRFGILTAGGDCPGLNAAIRGVVKAAAEYGFSAVGIHDGFRGLVQNNCSDLDPASLSGVIAQGGTLLGTSRDKPHRMWEHGRQVDKTREAVEHLSQLQLECLVCLGGNGTQKNAFRLRQASGVPVITLPKTIDNDVEGTDVSFGFDSALGIATEAIDRLHTTASSHQRIIVCETMGHDAGWLALGAGIAGGADVILLPELPYDEDAVVNHLQARRRQGERSSIIVVAEGVVPSQPGAQAEPVASRVAWQLQQKTGTETRVTVLGHVQRGGPPSAADRLLATRLGATAGRLLGEGVFDVMVAVRGPSVVPVPLEQVAFLKKLVPLDHPWLCTARQLGTSCGVDWQSLTSQGLALGLSGK